MQRPHQAARSSNNNHAEHDWQTAGTDTRKEGIVLHQTVESVPTGGPGATLMY